MLDFDSLYREFAPRVQRFVLGLSGDAAVAEDVTAETFVRVWATRDRVRHDTVRGRRRSACTARASDCHQLSGQPGVQEWVFRPPRRKPHHDHYQGRH